MRVLIPSDRTSYLGVPRPPHPPVDGERESHLGPVSAQARQGLRLLSRSTGKWAESAGENAKFGLSTAELLAATEMLKTENLSHCLKLLHFHIGSQVPDILIVKKAVQEASRFYAKLYNSQFEGVQT